MALQCFSIFFDGLDSLNHAGPLQSKNAGYDQNAGYVPVHARRDNGRYFQETE